MTNMCFVQIAKEYIITEEPHLIASFQDEVMLFMIRNDVTMLQNDLFVCIKDIYYILQKKAPPLAKAMKVAVKDACMAIKSMDAAIDELL